MMTAVPVPLCADLPEQIEAAAVGQHQVEHHQSTPSSSRSAAARVRGDGDGVPVAPQRVGDRLGDRGLVFDHENAGHRNLL